MTSTGPATVGDPHVPCQAIGSIGCKVKAGRHVRGEHGNFLRRAKALTVREPDLMHLTVLISRCVRVCVSISLSLSLYTSTILIGAKKTAALQKIDC